MRTHNETLHSLEGKKTLGVVSRFLILSSISAMYNPTAKSTTSDIALISANPVSSMIEHYHISWYAKI